MSLNIAALTFGCKVNQYETACILTDFTKKGYSIGKFNESAAIYLINTCTVTNRTDYKSRNAIRKALAFKKLDPNKIIIVTGCYAQRDPERIKELGDIDFIIDNGKKNRIMEILSNGSNKFEDIFNYNSYGEHSMEKFPDRTRAFVKIQDGCDFFCSYCAIPLGRGKSRSRSKEAILNQIELLIRNGYHEIVLGGINLGLYGYDRGEKNALPELLRSLEKIDSLKIIRLSSLEPQLFSDQLLETIIRSNKIAPHFHLALQHGSDEILQKMSRNYTIHEFKRLLEKMWKNLPYVALGFDLISGLPGETDQYFNDSFRFLNETEFAYLHVFPYSKRPGTAAAKMPNQIPKDVVRKRVKRLLHLSQQKKQEYSLRIIRNKVKLAGVIEKKIDNHWTALSDRYLRLYTKSDKNGLKGEYRKFIPQKILQDGLLGRIDD